MNYPYLGQSKGRGEPTPPLTRQASQEEMIY